MRIAELYLLPDKKETPLPVKAATLLAGTGLEGDCHAGRERQISFWDSRAKSRTHNLAYRGLCMKRFFANIILDGLGDAALCPGDSLQCGSAVIRITHTGKRCYPDECVLPKEGVACPLQCSAYGVVERGGTLLLGDGVLHKPSYEKARVNICLITENKKDFLHLLLLGDEQESQIDKYLERGDLFSLYDGDLKSVCVVTNEGGGIMEIQNLATDKRYQRQGYASLLIDYVAGYYTGRYKKIILGTGDVPGILAFYERRGFAQTSRIPDYFTTHYDHPMIEDGVLLKDKVYLERNIV